MTAIPVLLLGGTTEALALSERLGGDARCTLISSLAGRTVAHRLPPGRVRVGGFGGAAGLEAYLKAENIGLVVDATHPFAATISRHAAAACAAVGIPRLQVLRPAWHPSPDDRWLAVPDMAAAAAALPALATTAFLAVGRQELAAFAGVTGIHLVVRMIEAPSEPLPLPDYSVILARGPYALADEQELFSRLGIGVVVSKNSGGEATRAKLDAARALKIPVIMVERPEAPPGPRVETADQALAWIDERLDR